ncbi:MAG: LPS export ABC transporter ATP-binding protein [Candidatus Aminicenantes bacterium]|nr:LPS export ABC transporter ATP-binding protein [Candidatus Aminicenantes bacterium]NIM79546.1 LPS export ABC transporter ATP-binding protein [Candidatus Aminicenantes bacterium]NIN18860.1 LPS export ABC transporter ATP-binding protein [Candidatus Aminicenantes bacterium]NIN42773.1 LPS export ABC transporter ATP-binding protein [Candidatus Aminicenantes bacterium]NIN85500.1 LPS export ABC transporter ATP-binding protein [Candidatus Aminicenantes bacterium]
MKHLEGNGISKSFKNRLVVNNISLRVNQGEIIGLLGPNGAGKTTTFLMILGIHRPETGNILLNNVDITREPVYMRARMGIGFLPQEPSIFKGLTVKDNILAIMGMHPQRRSQDVDVEIENILTEMGILELKNRKAYLLSGGERRRLEIARSLVLSPDFLLLDEPFAGIDPLQIKEIQNLIIKLKERGLGVIITDHNVREILKITDRSYIINRGEIIFQGNSRELIANERVKTEYLGKEFRWN